MCASPTVEILRDSELPDWELDATVPSDTSSSSSNFSVHYNTDRFNILNFGVTNTRSISAKINSVVENFRNLELDFLTVSDTWLRRGKTSTAAVNSLRDESMGIVKRDRDSRGGGVAIVFDQNKLCLKEAFCFPGDVEAVCAVGKILASNRRIIVISAYIPPKTNAADLLKFKVSLKLKIEQIKADIGDCCFFLGADTNRRDIADCFENFPAIRRVEHGPTRNGAGLDVCFTNMVDEIKDIKICQPLEDETGVQSDHSLCFFKVVTEKTHVYTTKVFTTRKYSEWGEEEFGRLLRQTDWDFLNSQTPDPAVGLFQARLDDYCDQCFPWVQHKVRLCDKPWVTRRIERLIRRKRRAFKLDGKTEYWKRKRDHADSEIKKNKVRFLEKVREGFKDTRNPKKFYSAIKLLKCEDAPKPWNVCSLFPGEEEAAVAEKSALFFNKISCEFEPVPPPPTVNWEDKAPSYREVLTKIKAMKKPASKVKGDIDRRLVIKYPDLLATPLTIIFRSIYRHLSWPALWKEETVTLLPKVKAPETLSQNRNISCTPFFSKSPRVVPFG